MMIGTMMVMNVTMMLTMMMKLMMKLTVQRMVVGERRDHLDVATEIQLLFTFSLPLTFLLYTPSLPP